MTRHPKRSKLAPYLAQLIPVRAVFRGWDPYRRIMKVEQVAHAETGQPLCEHAWVQNADFGCLFVSPGDRIRFRARVHAYARGRAFGLSDLLGVQPLETR